MKDYLKTDVSEVIQHRQSDTIGDVKLNNIALLRLSSPYKVSK